MNPVNLLPAKHRPRTPTGGQQGSAYIVVGILGALLVMVVFYVLTVNGVNSRKGQVARANADTAKAQARAGSLSSYGDFSKIKQQRVQSVRQLATSRVDWERLTRGLARVLPDNVWLTSASATATGIPAASSGGGGSTPAAGSGTGPKVQLVGCAPSYSVVAVTLVRLRELSGAQDVQLNEISRPDPTPPASGQGASGAAASSSGSGGSDCGQLHGQPLAKWDAVVSFNTSAATSTGVPKSLGGGA